MRSNFSIIWLPIRPYTLYNNNNNKLDTVTNKHWRKTEKNKAENWLLLILKSYQFKISNTVATKHRKWNQKFQQVRNKQQHLQEKKTGILLQVLRNGLQMHKKLAPRCPTQPQNSIHTLVSRPQEKQNFKSHLFRNVSNIRSHPRNTQSSLGR